MSIAFHLLVFNFLKQIHHLLLLENIVLLSIYNILSVSFHSFCYYVLLCLAVILTVIRILFYCAM
jgi:hypothetical protein